MSNTDDVSNYLRIPQLSIIVFALDGILFSLEDGEN
jgi:hypothetical protein